jgi:hypothetical protein
MAASMARPFWVSGTEAATTAAATAPPPSSPG